MFLSSQHDIVSTVPTLIQLAVAPVFLIAGVAGLLNVFTSRLTRITDKLETIDSQINSHQKQYDPCTKEGEFLRKRRSFLVMRMQNINLAILFCTTTGLMVALVIISVFFSTLFSFNSEIFVSVFFILAMCFLITAFILFLREIYFTNQFIQVKKSNTQ